MPRTPRRTLLAFLLLWLGLQGGVMAQVGGQGPESMELSALLSRLEARYEIKFSYADQDIEAVSVRLDPQGSLEELLEGIRRQTGLKVERLSERYFSISADAFLQLCGRVFDNLKNPLEGASIEVPGQSLATISDAAGHFALDAVPREATLKIQYLGFRPQYVKAAELARKEPCAEVSLSVDYQELQEVVVYKFLTTGIAREPDGNISMAPGEFGLLPGLTEPDVLQIIQALPGIKSIDETVSDINIRGGTNDQNLLLWDGVKMYQSGHFFGLISAFNPYLTDRVDLIKNGSPAQYGDGLSGIISMHTHDQVERTYFGGGGFNLISGDAYAHLPLSDRMAFQFSARRSVTDVLNTPTYTQFSDRAFQDTQISLATDNPSERISQRDETFYFYDFSGKLLYDLSDRHQVRLNFLYIDNDLTYEETLAADDSQNRSLLDQTNLALGARLKSQWNEAMSTELVTYHTRYDLDSRIRTGSSGQELFQLNQVSENALKAHLAYRFSDLLTWQAGYQFLETGVTNTTEVNQPPFRSRIKNLLYTHALFSEWTYRGPGRRLTATGGVRGNYLRNPEDFSDFIVEPRLSVQYGLTEHLTLVALGEFKNQATHQIVDLEQNFLGIEKRRWILSDGESLPVATSRQASLGLYYDRGHWLASLEGFSKDVEGISTDTQGFQNQDQFAGELGSYRIYGLEALINYKTPDWSTWLSYAFNDNEYTFEALQPPTFPNNLDIRHTLTVGVNYTRDRLKVGVGLNYRTGRPFTAPRPAPDDVDTSVFPSRINFLPPNSSRLPDYLRADASVTYGFRLSETVRATLGASVLNLTGRSNLLNTYYRLNELEEVEKVESRSLGLTPNASFRLAF
ncbi:TonB-dependent receptor [Robiginitalea marina]|uniref:TonB-dependent receptor n=1 Tax=Robiginitalea marina TaxID=2954105 RepID=A0ABT1B038_9FLAO|nr:TonB-dependent receptor [Robiginitalea marina]MCO5725272.1 TonB-dependent receptor [Robiginitalea marina]